MIMYFSLQAVLTHILKAAPDTGLHVTPSERGGLPELVWDSDTVV